ncbi:hypothetical protein SUGI_1128930 [Cryptomeria japonica]|nr:hypothetical protein SUGI_1128930 [Cryptomeria japonica]
MITYLYYEKGLRSYNCVKKFPPLKDFTQKRDCAPTKRIEMAILYACGASVQGGLWGTLGGSVIKVVALARSLFGIVQMYLSGFDPRALAPLLNLFKIPKPLENQIRRMCLAQRAKMEIVDWKTPTRIGSYKHLFRKSRVSFMFENMDLKHTYLDSTLGLWHRC